MKGSRLSLLILSMTILLSLNAPADSKKAHGRVYLDKNKNGILDEGEPGISGVHVSNQRQITTTDKDGNWSLNYTDDTVFFVIKPTGYTTQVNENQLPQFYYVHKPKGSPKFKFPGVAATGELPASIDFPLIKSTEPRSFEAVFFGDPQPRSITEVEYIGHDVVEELIDTSAKFGVTLGDIVFDNLSLFEPLNGTIALIGIPWYNVIGNHDINFDAANDQDSDETFTRVYGPNYYSFNYGPVHFVVLDNIMWGGAKPSGTGRYTGGFGKQQMEFLKKDLKLVPKEKLVVFLMHIPITGTADREVFYKLIEDRPYTLSISGHTHWQAHIMLDKEQGFMGKQPHHHFVCVTVSGSWWSGFPDENGIPHTTMRDGVPNGYAIINFSENTPEIRFKAARKPASYQMAIHAPEMAKASSQESIPVAVNVFNGYEKSKVQMRINDKGKWIKLNFAPDVRDPFLVKTSQLEPDTFPSPYRKISGPVTTRHIWTGQLPSPKTPGVYKISVRATDINGNWVKSSRIIRIE